MSAILLPSVEPSAVSTMSHLRDIVMYLSNLLVVRMHNYMNGNLFSAPCAFVYFVRLYPIGLPLYICILVIESSSFWTEETNGWMRFGLCDGTDNKSKQCTGCTDALVVDNNSLNCAMHQSAKKIKRKLRRDVCFFSF